MSSRLTKKAEPPPTRGVNRDSGTASANGGWLRRLVRHHGQITENQMEHGGCNKHKIRNNSTIPPSTKQSEKMETRSYADRNPQMLRREPKIKVQAKTSCRV